MSNWLANSLIAFVPGLLWVWYFYKKDIYEPEPKLYILKVFLVGALTVLPAAAMERMIMFFLPDRQMPKEVIPLLFFSIFVIGIVEEFWKYVAVHSTVYQSQEFDENPMDGLIYGVTAGLGFAALENLFYTTNFGLGTGAVRAVITCLAHASFSGIVGYHLGLAKMEPAKSNYLIVKGIVLASILHGLYDFLFLSKILPILGTVPILFFITWQLFRRFQVAQIESPYNPHNRRKK